MIRSYGCLLIEQLRPAEFDCNSSINYKAPVSKRTCPPWALLESATGSCKAIWMLFNAASKNSSSSNVQGNEMIKLSTAMVMGAALVVSACGQRQEAQPVASAPPPPAAPTPAAAAALAQETQEEANKKVVLAFFREGITNDERYELLHPDYIQHNPMFKRFGEINHTKGREEFTLLMGLISKGRGGFRPPPGDGPKPPPPDPTYMVMADKDLVTVIQKRSTPDPQHKGQFYESYWFDTWRIKDGKMSEHWDAATIPEPIPEILKGPAKAD